MERKRIALITGGARGIGAAISRRLAHDGFNLHLNYHESFSRYEKLRKELQEFGISVTGTKADIQNPRECGQVVADCIKAHGYLWALILNAGVFIKGNPVDVSIEEWRKLIDTNLSSAMYLLKYALPHMRKNGGSIIFLGTGSIADSAPTTEYPCYAASKAGLYVLMRSLAVSEGKYGIRVNMVSPGMIDSGQYSKKTIEKFGEEIPLGRIGKPEDVASAVSFLLSDEASYISGANIDVSAGWVRSSYR